MTDQPRYDYYQRAYLEHLESGVLHRVFGPPKLDKIGRFRRILIGLLGRRFTYLDKSTGWVSVCIEYRRRVYIVDSHLDMHQRQIAFKRWSQK